ncbi:EAL domain-containing protein [bacterium]|nr:MAG: EAL domain-containing protein [bacterium]
MATDSPLDAEERVRLLLAQVPALMWTTDAQLRFTSSHGSALAPPSFAPDHMLGRTLYELLGTDNSSHPVVAMHLAALAGTPATGEVRFADRDFHCSVQPLTKTGDAATGTVGIAIDVTERKRSEEEVRRQRSLTRAMTATLADGLLVIDERLDVTFANEAAERMLGINLGEILGRNIYDLMRPIRHDGMPITAGDSDMLAALRRGKSASSDPVRPTSYTRRDGTRFPVLVTAAPIVGEHGSSGAVFSFRDISDAHTMQQELVAATERARRRELALTTLWRLVGRQDLDPGTLSHAILIEGGRALGLERGSVVHVDGELCVVDYLENFGDPSRYARLPLAESAAELVLSHGQTYSSPDLAQVEKGRHRLAVTEHGIRAYIGAMFRVGKRTYVLSFASATPHEKPFDEEDHTYIELLAGFFSRHLLTRQQQEWIVELASIDPLTGLPNRTFFSRYISDRISGEQEGETGFAVLAIGLDRFKAINSALGHNAGDRILLEASARMRGIVRGDAVLARLGDDEFAVLLPHLSSRYAAEHVARRICEALAAPFIVGDETVHLSASVGVVITKDHTHTDELLLQADVAMHRVKDDGRNGFRIYSNDLALQVSRRRRLETGLRKAIANQEFTLVFQPFVNLVSHSVVGAEALIRWQRPGFGVVNPDEFIGLAEESGLIVPIGSWALAAACAQAKHWSALGMALRIAVNISARQLQDPSFLSEVEEALAQSGVDPSMIGLEITESVAVVDLLATRRILQHCRDLGLRIALDDFGTRYSSLAYIRELPIDTIKVDRRFVEGLPADRTSAAITRAIIAFGSSLGFDTLAEGIETAEQEHWLAREGCRTAQGFLFAKPMAPAAFEQWLDAWPHRSTVA